MSIVTFFSEDMKETGQSMSVAAIATAMAIEHNYKILLISTDFLDKTLENCFWNQNAKGLGLAGMFSKGQTADVSNGVEGLIRTFASNIASAEIIRSYTKPVLRDRLDVLQAPKTVDYKEYMHVSQYFSQIADVANSTYDIVLIDLGKKVPRENKEKIINIADVVVVSLKQNETSINQFARLKAEKELYRRANVMLLLGRYNPHSKYSEKNVSRYLREKNLPLTVPYNILFADECDGGKIVDYFLKIQKISGYDNKDTFFVNQVRDSITNLEYKIQEKLNGLI